VLCTVPDPAAALREIRRALKPGGELRLMEHVHSPNSTKSRVQAWADRSGIWPRVAEGCHSSRDTVAAVKAGGFRVEDIRSFNLGPSWGLTNPHVLGVARPAADAPA
jgi:ubiquinone/menaquinone biosynthesis C-methylase UbiE